MKLCKNCDKIKLFADFGACKVRKDGLRFYCKECERLRENTRYHLLTPIQILQRRANNLEQKYKLTLEQYISMRENQNGGCAICFENQCNLNKWMAIDHCHATGKVRGLLCGECNRGIGRLADSATLIMRAANYVNGV